MTKIETLTDQLRERIGIPDDVRPDALDVLRRLKFTKVIADFREEHSAAGREARWDAQTRTIALSPTLWIAIHSGNEDADARFTVFHEVGHAVLGHTARNRRTGGKAQFGKMVEADENEADEFALSFAIPLKFSSSAGRADVPNLAALFGLPIEQASRRLVDLQRHLRMSERLVIDNPNLEPDTYAEAMAAMRINTMRWNA